MTSRYLGPVRHEPAAVELHNTLYAHRGVLIDGLADTASGRAWLAAISDRLPGAGHGRPPTRAQLVEVRGAVRDALHAAVHGTAPSRDAIDVLNRYSAAAPAWRRVRWSRDGSPVTWWDFGRATPAAITLSALATDAIDLVTGPDRTSLRACGAPGCVLMFVKQHTRRQWCSTACGNRARQARHYRRTKATTTPAADQDRRR